MRRLTFGLGALALLAACGAARADAIYSCVRDGRQVIADRPCDVYGASEKSRVEYAPAAACSNDSRRFCAGRSGSGGGER